MANPSSVQASKPLLGEAETLAVARVLATGYLGMGPETRAFERELESFFGGRLVVSASTGTSALHVALAALGIGAGDEVIVPSLTFVASFQAVAASGATPVACDVLAESGLIDLAAARRRVSGRTRAVMPVHYAGYPGDIDAVYAFARDHGLRVVEDAAHAFGSRAGGRLVGGFGDVACFSFDPIKNITCGQGGAIVTADETLAAAARSVRNLALESGSEDVRRVGWRYAMSDLNAAIGRVQLARFDGELRPHRQALAARYRERLAGCPGVTLLRSDPGCVPHIFVVRVPAARREAARAALRSEGFETLVHYRPNHLHTAFRATGCPVAEQLWSEILTLPLHGAVTLDHVDRVSATLARSLGAR